VNIVLSDVEARVLGCLIEKAATTPDYYPLTLNSLVSACNQKSSRDPVMSLDESEVSSALDSLRFEHHLVWEVAGAGSRALKYKHDAAKVLGVSDRELAILGVLMLRGPQTPGQLRSRAARLCALGTIGEIIATLGGLQQHANGPLVVKLPRGKGCREQRYAHLLSGEVTAGQVETVEEAGEISLPEGRDDTLALEVQALRTELDALKQDFLEFKSKFE
jgi:uncharacterized protein YceH (UPF0502 family)